jgi:hypothetical protein
MAGSVMYKKDPACIFTQFGWVEVDHNSKKVKRNVPKSHQLSSFLKSKAYQEGLKKGFFPKAKFLKTDDKVEWFEVDYIDFMTRANEWSTTQRLHAVRFVASLQLFLLKRGYFIAFPHLGNVTYDTKPIYMDLGDIRPLSKFNGSRELLHYFWEDMTAHDALGPYKISKKIKNWEDIGKSLHTAATSPCARNDLTQRIEKIKALLDKAVPADSSGAWSNYDGPPLTKGTDYKAQRSCQKNKSEVIYDTIKKLKPKTLIDLGSYRGFYSQMAASLGVKVLGMELCEDAVADAFKRALKDGHNCSYACINLLDLPKATGKDGAYRHIRKRIHADGVIVPAVTHHLSRKVGFKYQADLFADFADKWLLVEFVSKKDIHVATWGMPAWYTEDNFKKELKRHFKKLTVLDSYPSPRKWILCEK